MGMGDVNQDFIHNAILGVMPAALATGLFVSLARFQSPSTDFDSAGAFSGTYTDIAGLVDLPCTAPPKSTDAIRATEQRAPQDIIGSEWLHVLLNAYYPTLDAGWRGDGTPPGPWRMVIDGRNYEIEGVESDSQRQMTRVTARLSTM